jgi:hypothetical protein
MKRLIFVCLCAFLGVSPASEAFAWGAVAGPRGGAAYRGPMGGTAVRGPAGGAAYRGPAGGTAYRAPAGGLLWRRRGSDGRRRRRRLIGRLPTAGLLCAAGRGRPTAVRLLPLSRLLLAEGPH